MNYDFTLTKPSPVSKAFCLLGFTYKAWIIPLYRLQAISNDAVSWDTLITMITTRSEHLMRFEPGSDGQKS